MSQTTYVLKGLIHPQRATLSFGPIVAEIHHPTTNNKARLKLNIVLNQVTLVVDTFDVWDLYDLRNVAQYFVGNHVAMIGFIKGYAYDVEITQVLNLEKNVDQVFGIDIPCLAQRNATMDLDIQFAELKMKMSGKLGMYVSRCLNDLSLAMKLAHDTGFYCFRAIEALKQYCRIRFNLEKEPQQWEKLREVANCSRSDIDAIKKFADLGRHGDIVSITSNERAEVFMKTWDIVEKFLKNI